MTRTYKKSVRQVEVVDTITCDFCQQEIKKRWHQVAEAQIEMREGHVYPEGGRTVNTWVDICTQCFQTKLIPWLEGQGITTHEEEIDW